MDLFEMLYRSKIILGMLLTKTDDNIIILNIQFWELFSTLKQFRADI